MTQKGIEMGSWERAIVEGGDITCETGAAARRGTHYNHTEHNTRETDDRLARGSDAV